MKQFLANLKQSAEENPILALAVGAGLITAVGKLIDAVGHTMGRHAYAKQVNYRVKNK